MALKIWVDNHLKRRPSVRDQPKSELITSPAANIILLPVLLHYPMLSPGKRGGGRLQWLVSAMSNPPVRLPIKGGGSASQHATQQRDNLKIHPSECKTCSLDFFFFVGYSRELKREGKKGGVFTSPNATTSLV